MPTTIKQILKKYIKCDEFLTAVQQNECYNEKVEEKLYHDSWHGNLYDILTSNFIDTDKSVEGVYYWSKIYKYIKDNPNFIIEKYEPIQTIIENSNPTKSQYDFIVGFIRIVSNPSIIFEPGTSLIGGMNIKAFNLSSAIYILERKPYWFGYAINERNDAISKIQFIKDHNRFPNDFDS